MSPLIMHCSVLFNAHNKAVKDLPIKLPLLVRNNYQKKEKRYVIKDGFEPGTSQCFKEKTKREPVAHPHLVGKG